MAQFAALLSAQFVVGNVFASLGFCIAAWVKQPAYLMTTTMMVLVWLFSFAGFFVPTASITPGLRWLVTINPASYAFALFFQIILKVGQAPSFECSPQSAYEVCTQPSSSRQITPDDVLRHYRMDLSVGTCFAVLIGMYVACFALGYHFFIKKVGMWLT